MAISFDQFDDDVVARMCLEQGSLTPTEVREGILLTASGWSLARVVLEQGLVTEAQVSDLEAFLEERTREPIALPPDVAPELRTVVERAAANPACRFTKRFVLLEQLSGEPLDSNWAAWDLEEQRRVALRLVLPRAEVDQDAIERVVAAARAFLHPRVAPVREWGRAGSWVWVLGHLVEGTPLSQQGRLEPESALRIFADLARALADSHAKEVWHDGLRPERVILHSPKGPGTLVGLGLGALDTPPLEEDPRAKEEPKVDAFLPPEQRGWPRPLPNEFSEVYGFGAVLYFALTGLPPLRELKEGLVGSGRLVLRSARDREVEVPKPLDALVSQCLQSEPCKRPPNMAFVADVLEDMVSGPSLLGRLALAAAGVAAVALLVFALLSWGARDETPQTTAGATPPPSVEPTKSKPKSTKSKPTEPTPLEDVDLVRLLEATEIIGPEPTRAAVGAGQPLGIDYGLAVKTDADPDLYAQFSARKQSGGLGTLQSYLQLKGGDRKPAGGWGVYFKTEVEGPGAIFRRHQRISTQNLGKGTYVFTVRHFHRKARGFEREVRVEFTIR